MRRLFTIALALSAGCSLSESGPRYQTGLEQLALTGIEPGIIVPGSRIEIQGQSFLGDPWGEPELRLAGTFISGAGRRDVEVILPVTFVDFEHMEVLAGAQLYGQLGAQDGELIGRAQVVIRSAVDGQDYTTDFLDINLRFASELSPTLSSLTDDSVIFVNHTIEVTGDGMLLGGGEGTTYAEVTGCVALLDQDGIAGPCQPIAPVNVPVSPASPFDRQKGTFPFIPEIAGIRAGRFSGQIRLRNVHASTAVRQSTGLISQYELSETRIMSITPNAASMGQYILVGGGGFVGGETDQLTLLQFTGEYTPDDGGAAVPIDTVLVPGFVDGQTVRYVLNEDDDLGGALQLRDGSGVLTGQIAAIVSFRDDELIGEPFDLRVRVAPIKQVVYVDFTSQYTTSLQNFGLRSLDEQIRQRVIEVVERDFATVNLEVRTSPPDDFSIYSIVEIGGPDPNGLGLIGYDNTPGKDVGNLRLHDRIGGVNAQTQSDGFPGFGGVFIDSLFVFSEHPGNFAPPTSGQSPLFDDIFDPFRPDRGGKPVSVDEAAGAPVATSGAGCPASDRPSEIGCAVWVLGSLIGTTVSHELGHSLGLANPSGADVHILTDKPNRLMEGGAGRSFEERAELMGQGPAVFCDQEYAYLRMILPSDEPEDRSPRPGCL